MYAPEISARLLLNLKKQNISIKNRVLKNVKMSKTNKKIT